MEAATPDLMFMMDRQGVSGDIQANIYSAGARSIAQFAFLFKDTGRPRAVTSNLWVVC